ncbi:hypothetical protein PORY_001840 [Pneumocystis oryctolagi]|uniref:Uncharacterized protein n=1 Tax=Pneumocystis oryctolagi TaxID=42067 RepID=A0ACB7CAM9_9ASCO|nr:hypothetical protein PORY_001840 [Pneumocystis oryctolagi]
MLRSHVIKRRKSSETCSNSCLREPLYDIGNVLSRAFKVPGYKKEADEKRCLRKIKRVRYEEDALGCQKDVFFQKENEKTQGKDYPVFQAKNVSAVLKQKFSVPMANKEESERYGKNRLPPTLGTLRPAKFVPRPLHDPCGEFSIVLYDPTVDDIPGENEEKGDGEEKQKSASKTHKSLAEILGIKKQEKYPNVAVVIDPKLSKVLRPHQIEGVKFLYKCVTGMIDSRANGCIMADEMGLGKTLQCITLMWTLLKQSPQAKRSTIQKAIIVCPSSLVKNWANELDKWLGKGTINSLTIDKKSNRDQLISSLSKWISATGKDIVQPILIISYETLRMNIDQLKKSPIGLLLCDEGHRLKNSESLTFSALDSLQVQRRIILSGTPIQNDLSEYFSLLNFVNPGLLGSRSEFRKTFELPILKGRDALGTDKDREIGDHKLEELSVLVSRFIIRRTNDILSKYLPVKYEYVIFCNLTSFQKDLYQSLISSREVNNIVKGTGSQPLKAIDFLKKLCNHPDLLDVEDDLKNFKHCFPDDFISKGLKDRDKDMKIWYSGKMILLDRMLAKIKKDTNDKIVLISNYTQTLNLLEKLCRLRRYETLRLDGTMNTNKRQKLVDKFNNPEGQEFVFLLSSKAGGCGLNLIGANRLILFDPDWNPAADQQALARFIYRFIATGTIEEKIFQRQSHKQSLSSCVVDEAQNVERHFSFDSLRQLFELNLNTLCDTHDTFKCKRCKNDKQFIKAPALLYGDTSTWNHFSKFSLEKINDFLLSQETKNDTVSFVFQYITLFLEINNSRNLNIIKKMFLDKIPFENIENINLSKQPLRTYRRQKQETLSPIIFNHENSTLSTSLFIPSKQPYFKSFNSENQREFFSSQIKPRTSSKENSMSKLKLCVKKSDCLKKKKSIAKPKFTQLCLDLLPSRITCPNCGMSYTRGSTEDELIHIKFHSRSIGGIDYSPNSVKEVWGENSNKIIMITMSSPFKEIKKAKEILSIVDLELGSVSSFPDSTDQNSSSIKQYKFFLYLKGKKCVGLILVEPIQSAYPVCPSSSLSSSITLESKILSTYVMGVSRIWVCKTYRREKIATKLLNIACNYFVYGITVKKQEVAFSQPSESGKLFIESWAGKEFSNFKGIVVSSGLMKKTVKVRVARHVMHPKVQKMITLHKNYLVHDEASICENGDVVRIEACRPLSARKRFFISEILQKSKISQSVINQANQQTPANDKLLEESMPQTKNSN